MQFRVQFSASSAISSSRHVGFVSYLPAAAQASGGADGGAAPARRASDGALMESRRPRRRPAEQLAGSGSALQPAPGVGAHYPLVPPHKSTVTGYEYSDSEFPKGNYERRVPPQGTYG